MHKAGGFGAYGLLIGIRGEGAVGLGPGHHAPRLHAQAQRHHIGKRRRTLKRHGKIAHKSTGENRIGQSHDVIFTGSLIRDRVAIRSHPRTQHIQSPQHTRQRIRLSIAPQFGDFIHADRLHQREHPLNNRRVLAMAHTIQQCGSGQMAHLAQRLRIHATGQSIGHSRVELSRARGA